MVDLAAGLHDFDHCGFDGVSTIILNLALHLLRVRLLLSFRVQHGDLVAVHIAAEVNIYLHGILSRKAVYLWILDYNLLLDQWNQVLVEFVSGNLGHLEERLVRDDWILVEEE